MLKTLNFVVLLALIIVSFADTTFMQGNLTIIRNDQHPSSQGKSLNIIPAPFSSAAQNINDYIITIIKADPYDGCSKLSQPEWEQMPDYPIFLLVDGGAGKCGYKRRAQMAKNYFGAKGLIIVDDKAQQADDPYSSFSDETFLVFLIKQELEGSQFTASISMVPFSQEKVEVSIWLSSLNQQSYETIKLWNQTLKAIPSLKDKVSWRPRYALYGCNSSSIFSNTPNCENGQPSFCACGGAFCSPQVFEATPDIVVHEDIRQKIIFLQYNKVYMRYMAEFNKQCFKKFKENYSVQDCAARVMNSLGINAQNITNQIQNDNECLQAPFQDLLLDRNRFSQLGYYPSIIIHRQPLQFKNKNDLGYKVCKKLHMEKEQGCVQIIRKETVISTAINIVFFIAIIAGLIGVGALVVVCYRKNLKREMQKQVKMQVSASVQNYFALTQSK